MTSASGATGLDRGSWALRMAALAVLSAILPAGRELLSALAALALTLAILSFMPRGTRGLVFAAMVGMATCQGTLLLFLTGIFQAPITAEFGWTRTQYFLVTPISVLGTIAAAPLVGAALDRFGVRRVVLPSVLIMCPILVAYSRLTPHLWHLYAVAFVFSALGVGTGSAAYARVITFWFERRRGLALGAALAGVGIGGAALSPLVQRLVAEVGWRDGFTGLAIFILCVPFPLLLLWLRDSPAHYGLGMDGVAAAAGEPVTLAAPLGLTLSQGLRSPAFRRLTLTFGVLGFAVGGMLFQMFPILTSLRVAPATAAAVLGGLGLALIGGRVLCGFLMDRFFAPRVAVAFLLGPLIGCGVLASGVGGTPALVAALTVGLAAGAEVDVLAFLTARYLGRRAYASLYMYSYVAWSTGSGFGPILAARISDTTGSYSAALWAYAAIFAVASLLLLSLGPYPSWQAPADAEPTTGALGDPLASGGKA